MLRVLLGFIEEPYMVESQPGELAVRRARSMQAFHFRV